MTPTRPDHCGKRRFTTWRATASFLVAAAIVGPAPERAEAEVGAEVVVLAGEALLEPGRPPQTDVAISIRGERILKVEPMSAKPAGHGGPGVTVIDLSCCFVLPGLIDTQTHLNTQPGLPPRYERLTLWSDADYTTLAIGNARRTLEAGFTTIRNMGSPGRSILALRDAIDEGRIPGPRLQVAGEIVRPTGGELREWFHDDAETVFGRSAVCDGVADCRRAVRAQVARGSDTIKVMTTRDLGPDSLAQFELNELIAIRETAHRLGVRVTASAFSTDSIDLALDAGFDAIVHGTFADDGTFERLAGGDGYFIPTLVAARTVREMAENPDLPLSDEWREENLAIYTGMVGSFRKALASGARIAFGTDAGWRAHGGNAEQLEQMVELGMSPEAAIVSATRNAADAIGWSEDVGSLTAGKYADLIATERSPLEDISVLRQPLFVMQSGRVAVDGRLATGDSPTDEYTIVHAGRILPVPGRPAAGPHTIVVRGRLIHALHEGLRSPASLGLPDAAVVDLRDGFVMPGLLDTHVHLTTEPRPGGLRTTLYRGDAYLSILAAVHAERVLDAGFTTVMDMGTGRRAHEKAIFAVRDAIAAGRLEGPEILAAGSPISATGSSRTGRFVDALEAVIGPQAVCSGPADCRDAVREQVARGADFINFYNTGSLLLADPPPITFTAAEMEAIVAAAHALNRVAVADGGNTRNDASGIDTAIRAGADVIDTVTWPGPETFRLLRRAEGYFSPHVHALNAAVGDSEGSLTAGSMGWLPPPILESLFALKQETPSALAGYRAGARLVIGSDSGVFDHGLNANELVDYVGLGIEPMDTLAAATVNVAAAFRLLDRTGTLEAGKEADIVAFAGSPLEDMTTVRRPILVMSDGRIHRLDR